MNEKLSEPAACSLQSPPSRGGAGRRLWGRLAWALLIVLLGAGGWGLARYHVKRLATVRPGVLLRCGQPTEWGLRYLVRGRGVRTVLSLQTFDVHLRSGLYDFRRQPSGRSEAEWTRTLGARHVQWPMGHEQCWPFPTPWQFEAALRLYDDPENYPIVVHCAGGKHRTGSLVALFRLEYDRWPIERVLKEMYSFDFGDPQPTQELNLRTYWPRPLPTPAAWQTLRQAFSPSAAAPAGEDYAGLVRRLRAEKSQPEMQARWNAYLQSAPEFGASLALRLVDGPEEPLAAAALKLAEARLTATEAAADEWSSSAALVADFGTPEQQQRLLQLLVEEPKEGSPSPRYQAVVRGVTNRFTTNRVPYLRPLLDDMRPRPENGMAGSRYCDTAVARLAVIVDENLPLVDGPQVVLSWEEGLRRARLWFQDHEAEVRLTQLQPATGENVVTAVERPFPQLIGRYRK